jgi:HrpA-like RNA helicase
MGVKGVKALLRSVGWCPPLNDENGANAQMGTLANNSTDHHVTTTGSKQSLSTCCGCTTSLWKEWNASDVFMGGINRGSSNGLPMQRIPPYSKLLVDGNGLAFYLHSIAYSRYLRSLQDATSSTTTSTTGHSTVSSCPRIQSMSPSLVVQALPCMMPMSWLRGVTHEFVTTLKEKGMILQVYWDGPLRRHKARTDTDRSSYRQQQESRLELFCRHGILPSSKYACKWKDEFRLSGLFLLCVRHALQEQDVPFFDCTEEADVELALRACGDPKAYIVAYDSDFFFFRNVQYIPLDEISIHSSGLYAFCGQRSELARLLGLHDDDDDDVEDDIGSTAMIELALLMGNDYVDPLINLQLPKELQHGRNNPTDIVFFLQCQEDFQVQARDDDESRAAVDFVRALYNLENLDKAFAPTAVDEPLEVDEHVTITNLATLSEISSVRDGVLRCLQSHMDHDGPEHKSLTHLTLEAVEAYAMSSTPMGRNGKTETKPFPVGAEYTRPTWEEMLAGFVIESYIRQLYRSSSAVSIMANVTPPETVMNRLHFHSVLASSRQKDVIAGDSLPPINNSDNRLNDPSIPAPITLPIDEHQFKILENIQNNRVTIIHGETGCGKSSRVPVMLLNAPAPDGSFRKVKFFISQPRRIAAKALVERVRQCEPQLRNKFALRLGHGWREYESSETQVHFVTTGYLVRLLANHPERFDDCTHLVIDEVHERSVDTDILCLLCRRLLEKNEHIRLVLMSATLATKMYREYFKVSCDPIHVGVRRFPITEFYLDDLKQLGLPKQELADAAAIEKEIEKKRCTSAPTSSELSKRFQLTARLAVIVGQPGASVLIFVPGMAEIVSITEHIESFHKSGIRYTCFPIHSDIPFEEQMGAFDEPGEDEVKVIIATNAAESSVTLPNVDHVICLGLCRQIIYNQSSHRQMLTPAWISQASATQRSGRTGRVRAGSVYRLYTKHAFKEYLQEFEPGEMVRIPLDNVILMLKTILHEEVKDLFRDCLEPPPLDTIDRSFQSLYRWNFITGPDDGADITSLGTFVSSLGIDLSLGSFIGLGIQFGVAAEAIEMAAIMSLPKSPFQMSNPMWMTPAEFNETASKTYMAKCDMDGGLYSEPMALMNAIWDYQCSSQKNSWCFKNRIAIKRWQQVLSSRNALRKRVASFLGINEQRLQANLPPKLMPMEKVFILRLLKVWVFSNSIIECRKSSLKLEKDGSVVVSVKSKSQQKITNAHLSQILTPDRHHFDLLDFHECDQTGVFVEEGDFHVERLLEDLEPRFLSFASEKDIDVVVCHSKDDYLLYIDEACTSTDGINNVLGAAESQISAEQRYAFKYVDQRRRGFQERAAGMWAIQDEGTSKGDFSGRKLFQRIHLTRKEFSDFDHLVSETMRELCFSDIESVMKLKIIHQASGKKTKKASKPHPFQVSLRGRCKEISKQDMKDLMGGKPTTISTTRSKGSQSIYLQRVAVEARRDGKQPFFHDVPESARILALLASSQRRGNRLRFPAGTDEEATVDFFTKDDEVDVSKRWRRFDSDDLVYVDDSVSATAIHTSSTLYAVAANALELQNGGLRVEGLTLLPQNPLFLMLSFLAFGLEVESTMSWTLHNREEEEDPSVSDSVAKAYAWLMERHRVMTGNAKVESNNIILGCHVSDDFQVVPIEWEKTEIRFRLLQASIFHEKSTEMGEALVCFPERVAEVCALFDSIEGISLSPWETLFAESLTHENLAAWKIEPTVNAVNTIIPKVKAHSTPSPLKRHPPQAVKRSQVKSQQVSKGNSSENRTEQKLEQHPIRYFTEDLCGESKTWFVTNLVAGEGVRPFPSTNVLALLFQLYRQLVLDMPVPYGEKQLDISLNRQQWDIARFRNPVTGQEWYKAHFVHNEIPYVSIAGRGKKKLPKWIKKKRGRPSNICDAQKCVPLGVESPSMVEVQGGGIVFESIETAVQMEAAFWLEQQFCHASTSTIRHWYAHPMDQMIKILREHQL